MTSAKEFTLDPKERVYELDVSPFRGARHLESFIKNGVSNFANFYKVEADKPFHENEVERPSYFSPVIGTYAEVSKKARFMNDTLLQTGNVEWIFSVKKMEE
jgi:hypothetical protein